MIIKVEMNLEIDDEKFEEIKKIEHHADYFLDSDEYPEIKSVFDVKVLRQ